MNMISIIVPIYNSEKYLERCICSLINQTYTAIEIILINDGSKDNSDKICSQSLKLDQRIVYLEQNNCGVSAARNKGISIARGEYLMFVDSDDYVDKDICLKLVESMEENSAEQAICGYISTYYANEKITRKIKTLPDIAAINSRQDIVNNYPALFKKKLTLSAYAKLYKKQLVKENKIFFKENTDLGEDILFNCSYYKYVNKISIVNEALYYYQIISNRSLTRKYSINRIQNAKSILNKLILFSENMKFEKKMNYIFFNWYFKNCMLTIENAVINHDKKETKKMIEAIFDDNIVNKSLGNIKYKNNIEFYLYYFCFSKKNYIYFISLVYIRLCIKNIIRGTKMRKIQ